MKNKELVQGIIRYVGGEENVSHLYHCITRLRFRIVNKDKLDVEALKKISGVVGAQFQGQEFQIIIGNKVKEVYEELLPLLHLAGNQNETKEQKEKENIVNQAMDILSGVFVPILPAITGAGIIKSIIALLQAFHWIDTTDSIFHLLNIIADAAFYFLPFLLAVSTAKKFKTNEYLALTVAGAMMYPDIIKAFETGATMKLFGLVNVPMINYASSVMPIILVVCLMSYLYPKIDQIIPNTFKILLSPTLTLLITIPIGLILIGPLGFYTSNYVSDAMLAVFNFSGPVAGLVFGALIPIIVMTGMHYAVNPIVLNNLSKLGYDFVAPLFFISNLSQAGATFGVFFKSKDKEMKSLALSTGFSAIFGITEPAMYGVNLKLKIPFYCSLVASGIGSCVATFLKVKCFSFVMPGITGIPAYIETGKGNGNLFVILIGLVIAFLTAMILTTIFLKESHSEEQEVTATKDESSMLHVNSPFKGAYIPLDQVNDATFSSGIMGKGFAIFPEEGKIKAPFAGKVLMIAETKHALGLVSADGIELLIHLGIDTVKLNGNGFHISVKVGQEVKSGDTLVEVDPELLANQQYDLTSMVIVTNTQEFKNITILKNKGSIQYGETILALNK